MNLRLSPWPPFTESHSQTPTPFSTDPRLSRHRSESADDCTTPRAASTRHNWVADEVQGAVITSVPSVRSPSRMSRHRPVATFTTCAYVPLGA